MEFNAGIESVIDPFKFQRLTDIAYFYQLQGCLMQQNLWIVVSAAEDAMFTGAVMPNGANKLVGLETAYAVRLLNHGSVVRIPRFLGIDSVGLLMIGKAIRL